MLVFLSTLGKVVLKVLFQIFAQSCTTSSGKILSQISVQKAKNKKRNKRPKSSENDCKSCPAYGNKKL